MRTIQFVKDKDKIIRKAKETMEIYAPLADRMGMNRIRDELEDLSFSVLNKPARDLIIERLNFIKNNREDTFKSISIELIELIKVKWYKCDYYRKGKNTIFNLEKNSK